MRTICLVASVVGLVLLQAEHGRAQSGGLQGVIVFAPNATRIVTFSKGGVVVASFEVPKGNLLRVSYDDSQPNNAIPPRLLDGLSGGRPTEGGAVYILDHTARFELHGDVTVRAQSRQEFEQLGPGVSLAQSMTQAPLVVTAQGVDVVIAGVE